MASFFSIFLTLFFVIDTLGSIPTCLSLLKPFNKKKKRQVAVRELLIALGIMIIFHYFGQILLILLHVSTNTVQLAGGIILFLISIRLIFSDEDKTKWKEQELFIVPIATPIIAGPSVFATIMIFAQDSSSDLIVCSAIVCAWLLSSIIFFFAETIHNLIKDKGLNAAKRLMGLIITLISVQLFLEGLKGIIQK